jgi:hypothetical protein
MKSLQARSYVVKNNDLALPQAACWKTITVVLQIYTNKKVKYPVF